MRPDLVQSCPPLTEISKETGASECGLDDVGKTDGSSMGGETHESSVSLSHVATVTNVANRQRKCGASGSKKPVPATLTTLPPAVGPPRGARALALVEPMVGVRSKG